MTNEKTQPQKLSSAVGYRRPPAGARFRKGQSGNPRGRPKGSRNRPRPTQGEQLRAMILEEAYRLIKVDDEGKEVKMPMLRAVLRSLVVAAAKGEPRAQATLLRIVSASEEIEAANQRTCDEALDQAAEEPPEFIISIVDPALPKGAGT